VIVIFGEAFELSLSLLIVGFVAGVPMESAVPGFIQARHLLHRCMVFEPDIFEFCARTFLENDAPFLSPHHHDTCYYFLYEVVSSGLLLTNAYLNS